MIAPANIARASGQIDLIDVPPKLDAWNNATARNAYGTAAQYLVCKTLGLRPIPINGNYPVCFDAEDNQFFYEIKSCKAGAKVVIYDWRMEKEASAGVPVRYAILIHNVRGARTDILSEMQSKPWKILLLPLDVIKAQWEKSPLHVYTPSTAYQKRLGYAREGYKNGYRNLSVTQLLKSPAAEIHHGQ